MMKKHYSFQKTISRHDRLSVFLIIVLSIFTIGSTKAQLASWDAPNNVSTWLTELAPTSTNANVTITAIQRGSGLGSIGPVAGYSFGGSDADQSTAASAISNSDYFTMTIKANEGYTMSITGIPSWYTRRSASGTGSSGILVQYSLNGGTFTNIGSINVTSTIAPGGATPLSFPVGIQSALADLPSSITVMFRFVVTSPASTNRNIYLLTGNATNSTDRFVLAGTTAIATPPCSTAPTFVNSTNTAPTTTTVTLNNAGFSALGDCTISGYGFIWGTSSTPTTSDTKVELGTSYTTANTSFNTTISTCLTCNTTYYYCAYVETELGVDYGGVNSFTTAACPTYTVTFNSGTGTCSTASLTESAVGAGVALPTPTPSAICIYQNWTFAGWAETQDVSTFVANPYTPTADITLYAVYQKITIYNSSPICLPTISIVNPTTGTAVCGAEVSVDFDLTHFVQGTDGKVEYFVNGVSEGFATTSTININNLTTGPNIITLVLTDMDEDPIYAEVSASIEVTSNTNYNTLIDAIVCAGSSYDFYGTPLSVSGIYTHKLYSVAGCDSTITLELTVVPRPTYTTLPVSTTLCSGEPFALPITSLVPGATLYEWNTPIGMSSSVDIPAVTDIDAGNYILTLNNVGCVYRDTLQLALYSTPDASFSYTYNSVDDEFDFTPVFGYQLYIWHLYNAGVYISNISTTSLGAGVLHWENSAFVIDSIRLIAVSYDDCEATFGRKLSTSTPFTLDCHANIAITLPVGKCDTMLTNVTLIEPMVLGNPFAGGYTIDIEIDGVPAAIPYTFTRGAYEIKWIVTDGTHQDTCTQMVIVNYPLCGDNDIIYQLTGAYTSGSTTTTATCIATDFNGNNYRTVRLACDCWTAENLKSTNYTDGTPINGTHKYYNNYMYPDSNANAAIFGLLYTWDAAVRPADASGQGACPAGWLLPTETQYESLLIYYTDDLRSVNYWLTPGVDLTKFSALPAGMYDGSADAFYYLMGDAYFWITTSTSTQKACNIHNGCPYIKIIDVNAGSGASVRCIKE